MTHCLHLVLPGTQDRLVEGKCLRVPFKCIDSKLAVLPEQARAPGVSLPTPVDRQTATSTPMEVSHPSSY